MRFIKVCVFPSVSTAIDGIVTKANQTLAFLRRNLKICSTKTKDFAYKLPVRPLLEYATTVWDSATN